MPSVVPVAFKINLSNSTGTAVCPDLKSKAPSSENTITAFILHKFPD